MGNITEMPPLLEVMFLPVNQLYMTGLRLELLWNCFQWFSVNVLLIFIYKILIEPLFLFFCCRGDLKSISSLFYRR